MISANMESTVAHPRSPPSLGYLPDWWEGESLYGWCTRVHALRGGKVRVLGRVLFGREHACRVVDIPSGLDRFSEATAGLLGDTEAILRQRTVLASYWPFASDSTRRMLLDAANDVIGTPTPVVLGWTASRLGAEHPLRYCSQCHRESLAACGYSTWQVAQQLPGVWWCASHGRPLEQIITRRAIWRKPGHGGHSLGSPTNELEAKALALMARLAITITGLERIDEKTMANIAIHRLRQLGVATSAARLNNTKLNDWLEASPLFQWMGRQGDMVKVPGNKWASNLLRGRSRSHPLKWQILWACVWQSEELDVAVRAFRDAANGMAPIEEHHQHVLWLDETVQPPGLRLPFEVEDAFERSQTMREVAQHLGCNVGTVKQWLADYPALADRWLARLRRDRASLAVSRIRDAMKREPGMSRSEMLKACNTDVNWLSRNAPRSLRSLIDQLPVRRGPQGALF